MYKGIENEWLKYHDFLILDLLAVQAAYWLSYLFLFWYAGTPDESFYSNQAYVLFVIQVAVSLIMLPYSRILQRSNDAELLNSVIFS